MAGLLTDAQLASLQAKAVAAVCDKTCQIYRNTPGTGIYGQASENYTLLSTTVAGVTQPSATLLQNYDYEIGSLATFHVKVPTGTDVQVQDHLVIEGKTLKVHVILTPQSYSIFTNLLAAEVK